VLNRLRSSSGLYRRLWCVALKPESMMDCISRSLAVSVGSADELAAGTLGGARAWIMPGSESPPDHSRIMRVDGHMPLAREENDLNRPSIPRAYLRMPSAVVFPPAGLLMPRDGTILLTSARDWVDDNRLMPGFVAFEDGMLIAGRSRLRPVRRISRPVLNICHVYPQNYSHWLLSNLPWIMPWLSRLRDGRLALLAPALKLPWQRRSFELLGVSTSAIIEAPEHAVNCDDLIQPGRCYPPRLNHDAVDVAAPDVAERRWFGPPEEAVLRTVAALKAAARPSDRIERPERIYISRRGGNSFRKLENEAEIEEAVRCLGFKIVRTEEHSLDDQIAMFSRARVVVGPHGAGMTNTAFAPPGCLVCDFFPDSWRSGWSLRLTQLFGHRYLALSYPSDASRPNRAWSAPSRSSVKFPYRIAQDELIGVLTNAMRSLGLAPTPE
jgi:capsular polysaccharide biosynthesis protein